ncbi:MAG: glycosyltransferase family 39 protein [bacterium]|nr:glycosyltransferase family 39 protein [bacterium]
MFQLPNNRNTWLIYAALMSIVALASFGNLFYQDFWDGADDESVMADMRLLDQDLSHIISNDRIHDARPPFDLLMLGAYKAWGENPGAFHFFLTCLHLWVSLLLAISLIREGVNFEIGLLTGLLFLVNVAHFRVVHWITSINYVLALVFVLLVWICFRNSLNRARQPWLIVAIIALGLSVLTHPDAAFIALFCTYLAWRESGSIWKALAASWPLLLCAPILVLVAHGISVHGQSEAALSAPEFSRIATNLLWYLSRLITSAHWIFRSAVTPSAENWELLVGGVVLIGLLVLIAKDARPSADGAVWILISILPFLNNPAHRLAGRPVATPVFCFSWDLTHPRACHLELPEQADVWSPVAGPKDLWSGTLPAPRPFQYPVAETGRSPLPLLYGYQQRKTAPCSF